jgi:endonuclease I
MASLKPLMSNNSMSRGYLKVRLAGFLVLLMSVTSTHLQAQQQVVLFPGVTGNALIDSIRVHFKPATIKGYNEARDSMFMSFNYLDGAVECFYTGDTVRVQKASARIQAQNRGFNTEHIWPQSKFIGRGNAYSDLHHLRPSRADVNQSRNNYRFKPLATSEVTTFWRGRVNQSSIPNVDLGSWSKTKLGSNLDNSFFEPRDVVKGDVARAMFYFYTMYEEEANATDRDYFPTQMNDLLAFHKADPASALEYQRTLKIATIQSGKANPFILDSTLVRRAYFTNYSGPVTPPVEEGTFAAEYSFSGTADCNDEDLEPTRQNQGVTLSNFYRVGVNCNVVSNALNSNGWPSSFSSGHYIAFNAEVANDYTVGFSTSDTLRTFIRRSSTGPGQYRILLITDGITQVLREGNLSTVGSNVELKIGMPNVTKAEKFEIRIHAWGATSTAGTFRISTFSLKGLVSYTNLGTGFNDPSLELPTTIQLYPAYPNPFNPGTMVAFRVDSTEFVELSLYDVLGRHVTQLAKGIYTPGYHTVSISGDELSSGVYMVRLTAKNAALSSKITLVK